MIPCSRSAASSNVVGDRAAERGDAAAAQVGERAIAVERPRRARSGLRGIVVRRLAASVARRAGLSSMPLRPMSKSPRGDRCPQHESVDPVFLKGCEGLLGDFEEFERTNCRHLFCTRWDRGRAHIPRARCVESCSAIKLGVYDLIREGKGPQYHADRRANGPGEPS